MVTSRRGQSLVELIVALVFLSTTLGAIGASAVHGARWTTDSLRRQEALALAASVLDSLVAGPAPTSGSIDHDGIRVEWDVTQGHGGWWLRITAGFPPAASRLPPVRLHALWTPPPPVLPVPESP